MKKNRVAILLPYKEKYTLKDDTNLFAKELNLNPEDYKAGEIVDIAIDTIRSSENPLLGVKGSQVQILPFRLSLQT